MTLEHKTIIVTGAASGIGFELVKQLLSAGAHVLGVDLPSEKIPLDDERLHTWGADLSSKDDIDGMFVHALRVFGNIDVFIANAGFAYYERLTETTWEHITDIYDINVFSMAYSAVKMKEIAGERPFHFVSVSSVMNDWPLPGYSLYASTKAAAHTFIKGYRHELPNHQCLHSVFPVSTKTKFFEKAGQTHRPWFMQTPEHVAKSIIKGIRKNKKNIHPSKLFRWAHRLCPWCLSAYIRREVRLLMEEDG